MTSSTTDRPRHRLPDLSQAAGWALALTLVGYPLAGLVGSVLNWDSVLASVPYRVGVLALSAFLLIRSGSLRPWLRRSPWLAVFALLYLSRLIWDIGVAGVPGASDALAFYVVTVLVPSAAVAAVAGQVREDHAAMAISLIGGVACVLAVTMYSLDLGLDRSLTEQSKRLSFEAVNPITLGHLAVSTIIANLVLARRSLRGIRSVLLPCSLVIAFSCLVLAASRAPLLALGVCVVFYAIVAGNWRVRLVLCGTALLLGISLLLGVDDGNQLLSRFSNLDEDNSSLQRLLLQSNAISQFIGSPIIGSAFAELEFLEYPHNMFIETAMALGTVGIFILVRIVYLAGLQTIRRVRVGELLIPLLLLQNFIAFQFSGALWGASGFWILMAATLGATELPTFIRNTRYPRTLQARARHADKAIASKTSSALK